MKAVIPAAGLGTRFLPATKAVPKELLPVLDKPVIQYVVEEALSAEAVDAVVIVNSHDKPQINAYFAKDAAFEEMLRERGKNAEAAAVAAVSDLPVEFAYQDEALGLGHAVLCAADAVGDDPFLVLLGDYFAPGGQMCKDLLAVSAAHGNCSVIAVAPVPADQVSRYGIIGGEYVTSLGDREVGKTEPGAVWKVSSMVEKPTVDEAPSNLFIVGRYLLTPAVMKLLATQEAGAGGEIQLTDALVRLLADEEMYAVVVDPTTGCDTGTPAAFAAVAAKLALAADQATIDAFHEELGGVAL